MSEFWKDKRVIVTGGAGFLGSYVIEKLKLRECAEIVIPIMEEYDLRQLPDIKRLLSDAKPDLIIYLAAVVGGIGGNMANPSKYFYDNLIMGIQLMD
jgi:GDP-L-fucose synthase